MAVMQPYGYSGYWEKYKDDSSRFLYMVRDKLNTKYPNTKVSSRQICVKLNFTEIVTDIIPGLPRRGGGYLIPNGQERWMATNPPFHHKFIDTANSAEGGELKKVIQLFKYWNGRNDHLLLSFHMDLLTKETYWRGLIVANRAYAMKEGLRSMVQYVRRGMPDPWADGGTVSSHLSSENREKVIRMLETDLNNAKSALNLEDQGRTAEAFNYWDKVFRNGFPAYG